MKWTYSIQQKTTAAVLLAAIFAVIFIVNRLENNKINELGESMNSVYEDRLMVENYIFRLSGLLYEKKILLDQCVGMEQGEEYFRYLRDQNTAIALLVEDYDRTQLTEQEATLFNDFKNQLLVIQNQESRFLNSDDGSNEVLASSLNASFQNANVLLMGLSNVQINVGKSVNERSKELVAGSTILTRFELGMLVIIGIHLALPSIWLGALVAVVPAVFVVETIRRQHAIRTRLIKALITLAALLYVALPAALLVATRNLPSGFTWLLTILCVTWGTDSFAYIGGRLWGRTKLAPHISPKKTVEGAIVGVIGGIVPAATVLQLAGLFSVTSMIPVALGPLIHVSGRVGSSRATAWRSADMWLSPRIIQVWATLKITTSRATDINPAR